jgi:hypothetical protein
MMNSTAERVERVEVRTFQERRLCSGSGGDPCGGHMVHDAYSIIPTKYGEPTKYRHRCSVCGVVEYLTGAWPRITYEPIRRREPSDCDIADGSANT